MMQHLYPWIAWIGGGFCLSLAIMVFFITGSWETKETIERLVFCFFWMIVYLVCFTRWILWG